MQQRLTHYIIPATVPLILAPRAAFGRLRTTLGTFGRLEHLLKCRKVIGCCQPATFKLSIHFYIPFTYLIYALVRWYDCRFIGNYPSSSILLKNVLFWLILASSRDRLSNKTPLLLTPCLCGKVCKILLPLNRSTKFITPCFIPLILCWILYLCAWAFRSVLLGLNTVLLCFFAILPQRLSYFWRMFSRISGTCISPPNTSVILANVSYCDNDWYRILQVKKYHKSSFTI